MPVQTCTKGKPASVVTHRTGGVELCLGSTHSIHRLHTGVNCLLPRICCPLSSPDWLIDLLASRSFFGFLSPAVDHCPTACDSQGGG
jgi:hypothetical protein